MRLHGGEVRGEGEGELRSREYVLGEGHMNEEKEGVFDGGYHIAKVKCSSIDLVIAQSRGVS